MTPFCARDHESACLIVAANGAATDEGAVGAIEPSIAQGVVAVQIAGANVAIWGGATHKAADVAAGPAENGYR